MFLDQGCKDQIRYVAYVPGMAGNLADWWGLSYLEPTKPQSILIKSAQIRVTTCSLIRVLKDQIRYVAYMPGMAGNLAGRWGLSYSEPTEPQSILEKSAQI